MSSTSSDARSGVLSSGRTLWFAAAIAIVLAAAVVLYRISFGGGSRPAATGDYWMYAGTYTTRGGKGIYLYRFHAATGKVEARGIAAGRMWQANRDAWLSSPTRIFSQIRVEWPDLKTILKGVQDPVFIAFHPTGRFLYTADSHEAGTLSSFQVDPVSGKLTMINNAFSGGGIPVFLTVDRAEKNLLVANYSGSVAVLPISDGGHTIRAASSVRREETGAGTGLSPHAHSIVLSPGNRFAIVPDTGLNAILVYKFDSVTGTLTPNDPPFLKAPEGASPRHFAFHPNGVFAYAVGESGSCVMAMRWDAQRGTLSPISTVSTLPEEFRGKSAGADVAVHPSGRFLYASNRGHDSIAVFSVDPDSGTPAPLEYESSYGKRPSNLRIDPTGNYLFAANVGGNNIVEFRIDPQTGRLTKMESFDVPVPMAMAFVPAS